MTSAVCMVPMEVSDMHAMYVVLKIVRAYGCNVYYELAVILSLVQGRAELHINSNKTIDVDKELIHLSAAYG